MSFNSVNQYAGTHKTWDHVGNIIPNVMHSEGITPAGEWKPASWLPVQFYDKHYENWYVVTPGKPVALDPDGMLMPAHYGLTGATVTYTQNDIDAGVIDIATGLALTATKSVALASLTGTRGGSWTAALAGTNNSTYASGFMGRYGVSFADATAKPFIGVAPYGYLQWCGGDGSNPANYRLHNYNMQHQAAVLCDYVLRLPVVPGSITTESCATSVTATALVIGTNGWHSRDKVVTNSTGRYNATTGTVKVLETYPVMALALDNYPVSQQTVRTTLALASNNTADSLTGILVNEKTALSAVAASGDYFVDYPAGVIFIYAVDGATLPVAISGAAGAITATYYYNTTPSVVSKFACILGVPQPGDLVSVSTNSNYAVSNTWVANTVGQVIALETWPRSALDKVKTAYSPALTTNATGSMANGVAATTALNLGQLDQMPGSATSGYTDLLTYAGGANLVAIVNLISR